MLTAAQPQAGTMQTRVEIQTRASGKGSTGQNTGSWTTQFTRWAEKRVTPQGEDFAGFKPQHEEKLRLRLYDDPETKTIKPGKHRAKIDDRIYKIDNSYTTRDQHADRILECTGIREDTPGDYAQ